MQGDVVYPGMPRVLYPGIPVPYDDQAVNIAHAQHYNANCIGSYHHVAPFHQHPFALPPPPPFPYYMVPPPPVPSSSLTQALVNQYAPMCQRQLSFDSTDAAGISWQQHQQKQPRPSRVLPTPPPPPAPASVAMFPQLPSPTLSPATVASLLGPGDGMSTTKLDELPTFFLGQIFDDHQQNNNSEKRHRGKIVAPSPFQHHDNHKNEGEEEKQHKEDTLITKYAGHIQRNTSCDTIFSEASPPRVAPCGLARVQVCPSSAPLFESPFMPLAGTIVDIDRSGRDRLRSIDSDGDHHTIIDDGNDGDGGDVSGNGQMHSDPLEGVDMELLFQHFKEDYQEDKDISKSVKGAPVAAADLGRSDGVSANGKEVFVAGKQERASSAQKRDSKDQFDGMDTDPKEYGQNLDLQNLFQSFIEDIDALPPLDLAAIGKCLPVAAAPGDGNVVHYTRNNNRKRFSSETFSYGPHTPEKKNFYGKAVGGLGLVSLNGQQQRHRQQGDKIRRVVERKTTSASPQGGSAAKRRIQPQAFVAAAAFAPCPQITAMLPSLQQQQQQRRYLKFKNDSEEEEEESSGDEDEAIAPIASSALTPARCFYLFGKSITASDAGRLARIVLPRAAVEQFLPRCESKNGLPLTLWGVDGSTFNVMLKYWMNGRPVAKRMWLLDQCQELINALELAPGKQLEFFKASDGRLVVRAR